jgi:hypothetical protein
MWGEPVSHRCTGDTAANNDEISTADGVHVYLSDLNGAITKVCHRPSQKPCGDGVLSAGDGRKGTVGWLRAGQPTIPFEGLSATSNNCSALDTIILFGAQFFRAARTLRSPHGRSPRGKESVVGEELCFVHPRNRPLRVARANPVNRGAP